MKCTEHLINLENTQCDQLTTCLKNAERGIAGPTHLIFWKVWKLNVPLKIIFFLWQDICGAIPTTKSLRSHHCMVDNICELCSQDDENLEHLFFNCAFAKTIWFFLQLAWNNRESASSTTGDLAKELPNGIRKKWIRKKVQSCQTLLRERCAGFGGKEIPVNL